MQPRRSTTGDEPIIDVRILEDTGGWQQRSSVFADAGLLDALLWVLEAAGTTVVGNAAWNGMRGLAFSRQRGGRPSPRLAAHAVARRFIEERFGDVVQPVPYEEDMLADGSWHLSFNSEPPGRRYVVKLRGVRRPSRQGDPKVLEAKRTDLRRRGENDQ